MEEDLLKNQGMQINIKMTKSSFLENKKKSDFYSIGPWPKEEKCNFWTFFWKIFNSLQCS